MIYDSYSCWNNANNGKPRVVRLRLCALSDYLTPYKDSDKTLVTGEKVYKDKFAIVGTSYGFLHNSSGNKRLWNTYSAAYKFLKANFT